MSLAIAQGVFNHLQMLASLRELFVASAENAAVNSFDHLQMVASLRVPSRCLH